MPTILIVDDEDDVLQLLSRILVGAMLSVLTASDAVEAEQLLETEEVDLVLTDVYMRGRSGLELLERVRARAPELPVILMSGNVTPELTRNARKAGAYEILSKPFDNNEFLRTLASALR